MLYKLFVCICFRIAQVSGESILCVVSQQHQRSQMKTWGILSVYHTIRAVYERLITIPWRCGHARRCGSSLRMSTELALPSTISSAMTRPVAGPFKMPQQLWPAACNTFHVSPTRHSSWDNYVILFPVKSFKCILTQLAFWSDVSHAEQHTSLVRSTAKS